MVDLTDFKRRTRHEPGDFQVPEIDTQVRFAPSPTGAMHVGNLKTALINWLIAKRAARGHYYIRIEDTDRRRYVEGAEKALLDALQWAGLNWNASSELDVHGRQSERLQLYHNYAEKLLRHGFAYICHCNEAWLTCRCSSHSKEYEAYKEGAVVRFKMPTIGVSAINDTVYGRVEFQNALEDDFVIIKVDGYPTYHFASVVDDYTMQITHVVRGKEWLSSIPKHVQLYKALGWPMPTFIHLPWILDKTGAKLSKRKHAAAVEDFRRRGILPDALINYLMLLSWSSPIEGEIMTREEMIEWFDPKDINRADAKYDSDKLLWMNGWYIRDCSEAQLVTLIEAYWRAYPPNLPNVPIRGDIERALPLFQTRIKTLAEVEKVMRFAFVEVAPAAEQLVPKGKTSVDALKALTLVKDIVDTVDDFSVEKLTPTIRSVAEETSLKTSGLFSMLRIALTEQKASPPIVDCMVYLGRKRTALRLKNAIHTILFHGDL